MGVKKYKIRLYPDGRVEALQDIPFPCTMNGKHYDGISITKKKGMFLELRKDKIEELKVTEITEIELERIYLRF